MSAMWILQAVTITLVAGFGLGYAIRFSMVARAQDRQMRIAPYVDPENLQASTVPASNARRAPTV